MHFLPDISFWHHCLHLAPLLLFGLWSNSGGNKASSNTETNTTSGQNSPAASGGSQAIGSGSIGVAGAGAKYLEQGAVDAAGAQIGGVEGSSLSASSGGTIQIGDPGAVQTIAALAQNFADTVQSVGSGGGGSTTVVSPSSPAGVIGAIPWGTIVTGLAAIIGIIVLGRIFGGKKT